MTKITTTIPIIESPLQYNQLKNNTEHEFYNCHEGNPQDLDEIPEKNKYWRTMQTA